MRPFLHCGNTRFSKKLVHGVVIVHESELVLVVKLHILDFCCNAPYFENEVVSANFVHEIPNPRLAIELLVLHELPRFLGHFSLPFYSSNSFVHELCFL